MNASVAWLNAFLDAPRSATELRDLLTAHTATVEDVVALRTDLAPIVIGLVVEAGPHPDSDHLHVTKVDAGTGTLLDVVCGAANVRAGARYPFAPTGTVMPGGLKIEKRKIRGATSNGMLCSARELGLGTDHEGILELDTDAAPGTPFLAAVQVGDVRLVVDVLPNRPDLLSHLGLARELGAVTGSSVQLPDVGIDATTIPAAKRFRRAGNAGGVVLHLEDASLASRFMGVVIRGVAVGASPDWLVERLASVGSRSINNVVDASNYILHELGQPTHAYDLGLLDLETQLPEKTVVVRRAKDGETLVTLDGVTRTLTTGMTVIADSAKPIGLAGVMGGRDTEVTAATTDLFVEVATFGATHTRRTRRLAGLSTDASYRFERGVDAALAPVALERVARLILSLAGGRIETAPVDLYAGEPAPTAIPLRTARVARVLGVPLQAARVADLLGRIGCQANVDDGGSTVHVVVPSWRSDLVAEVDLIEDVARLHGYDALPDELRPFRPGTSADAPQWAVAARLRDMLSGSGLLEARTTPFMHCAEGETGHVRVRNPLSESEAFLRRHVLETLMPRAQHNLAHMQRNIRLFEIGSGFMPTDAPLPEETMRLGILVMGDRDPAHFTNARPGQFDEWDARALGERAARTAFPGEEVTLVPVADERLHLWDIHVAGAVRGTVMRLPIDGPVWAAPTFGVELVLGGVSNADVAPPGGNAHDPSDAKAGVSGVSADGVVAPVKVRTFKPLPSTPASEFDLALLLPDGVRAADVERVIREAAGELLERLAVFDVYEGQGIPAGHRSVAWRLTLRHPERTLRDKEIEGRRSRILSALQTGLNVRQRTT